MKFLIFLGLVISSLSHASVKECPVLKGTFFCKAVAGSHKEMRMKIYEVRYAGKVLYEYLYEQRGEPALRLRYLASDQGVKNFDFGGMVGKCIGGYYFNSSNGILTERTLLNTVNADGHYQVLRNKDKSEFLLCRRVE